MEVLSYNFAFEYALRNDPLWASFVSELIEMASSLKREKAQNSCLFHVTFCTEELIIPAEVVENIMQYCDASVLCTIACCCKEWQRLSCCDVMWSRLLRSSYSIDPKLYLPTYTLGYTGDIKRLYKMFYEKIKKLLYNTRQTPGADFPYFGYCVPAHTLTMNANASTALTVLS
jgi:hypothetical protein